ncbi:hypothetical protein BC830DRAFT_720836 [Chytriomyces sp. MP71]|nr:hypothetical protein BC830DRAFT_720836 [Chytriomyces sp. MP71]
MLGASSPCVTHMFGARRTNSTTISYTCSFHDAPRSRAHKSDPSFKNNRQERAGRGYYGPPLRPRATLLHPPLIQHRYGQRVKVPGRVAIPCFGADVPVLFATGGLSCKGFCAVMRNGWFCWISCRGARIIALECDAARRSAFQKQDCCACPLRRFSNNKGCENLLLRHQTGCRPPFPSPCHPSRACAHGTDDEPLEYHMGTEIARRVTRDPEQEPATVSPPLWQ